MTLTTSFKFRGWDSVSSCHFCRQNITKGADFDARTHFCITQSSISLRMSNCGFCFLAPFWNMTYRWKPQVVCDCMQKLPARPNPNSCLERPIMEMHDAIKRLSSRTSSSRGHVWDSFGFYVSLKEGTVSQLSKSPSHPCKTPNP